MGIKGKKKEVKMISEIRKYKIRGLNKSQIARALNISRNTVKKYLKLIGKEQGPVVVASYRAVWSDSIDWKHVLREQSFGTQLAHYWEQNIEKKFEEITYISFWREFRRRHPNLKLDMHQSYVPGLRAEFDYKGIDRGFCFIDKDSGELVQCRLFGMVLPSSQLLFARATLTEKQEDVFDSIARGFERFGGVTGTIAFDNARVQVTKSHQYDPDLNSEFSLLCDQYNLAPIAARPKKPKDKCLIENSLGVFWRWSWPQLKRQVFYSLQEVNSELTRLLELFNNRIQKKYGMSRQEKFESYEREKLKPLPEKRYELGFWKKVKVHPDSHIQMNYNFFSVPHQYRGQYLNARISKQCLEIYSGVDRVAIHKMPVVIRGTYLTTKEHLPDAHKAILEQTPKSLLREAAEVGNNTCMVVTRLIEEARHPLMYLRRAQGILRFKRRYSVKALEDACAFFSKVPIVDIRINNIEQVISAQVKKPTQKKVKRQSNENLRGQLHWAETYH